jgi:prepilin-type N-terminal cleavage/methylation domain-containing protein
MTRSTPRQSGFTLLEVMLALAAGALLLSAVLPMLTLSVAAATNPATTEQADLDRQAAFAMERIARAVRARAPAALSAQSPATTGTWLAPATFQLSGSQAPYTLVEKRDGDAVLHVLAESVQSVTFTALPLSDGRQLIQVDLALQSANASTSLSSVMRMGWLQ